MLIASVTERSNQKELVSKRFTGGLALIGLDKMPS